MKYLLFVLLVSTGCKTQQMKVLKKITETGYAKLEYKFSDNGDRNLTIHFRNDSILLVSNVTNIGHHYPLVSFNREYAISKKNINTLIVGRLIFSDKTLTDSIRYFKPYESFTYALNSASYQYIFPDISGDTIRFSSDFKKLQIREFSFDFLR